MFESTRNPTIHTELNGKKHRYCTGTTFVRALRLDHEAERAFMTLREVLAQAQDVPSTSLLMRRALKVYRSHVQALKATPGALDYEKVEVRKASHVPRRKIRKTLTNPQ